MKGMLTDGGMADDEESLPQEPSAQKRGRGRPRIHPVKDESEKRPRGRPKKPELLNKSPEIKRPRGRPRKSEQASPAKASPVKSE